MTIAEERRVEASILADTLRGAREWAGWAGVRSHAVSISSRDLFETHQPEDRESGLPSGGAVRMSIERASAVSSEEIANWQAISS